MGFFAFFAMFFTLFCYFFHPFWYLFYLVLLVFYPVLVIIFPCFEPFFTVFCLFFTLFCYFFHNFLLISKEGVGEIGRDLFSTFPKHFLDRVVRNFRAAVLIDDALVVMAAGAALEPLALLRDAAVSELPYEHTAYPVVV